MVATCQKCHPGATRRFAGYLTHATHHDPQKYPWLFWSFWGMTGLLIGTFTIGGAHTLLWLPAGRADASGVRAGGGCRRARREVLPVLPAEPDPPHMHDRQLHQPGVHGHDPEVFLHPWAATVSRFLGGFESAGYIHRLAATLMIGVFVAHVWDLTRRKRLHYKSWRKLLFGPDTMLPTWKDARDAWESIKWFLGLGPRPSFGRWTYWEKFDYFAVFWGIAVIGSTGMTLWFPEFFTRLVPGWFINMATIIHSDEALLATGFIFTVHFFNTHLRPEKFPMDIVVFTGRMPLEEFRRDKPAEYEALVQRGELENHLVEPYPPIVIRTVRFFAWLALAIGFSMVVWIVCAMLFSYK